MDIEHSVFASGLDYGYRFRQSDTAITVSYALPSDSSACAAEFALFDGCICCGLRGADPVICGALYDDVSHEEHFVSDGRAVVRLRKANVGIWPILIAAPSPRGIDAKSQFLLGVYCDALGDSDRAFALMQESARRGFFPAQVLVADVLLSDANPYGAARDAAAALQLLEAVARENVTVRIVKTMVSACIECGRRERALGILRDAMGRSNELKKMYAVMLSPLADSEGNQPAEAVEVLTELANENDIGALELLAEHYAKGVGVPRDAKRAKELLARISQIDPSYRKNYKISSIATNVLVTVVLSSVIIGAASLIWFRKKKN